MNCAKSIQFPPKFAYLRVKIISFAAPVSRPHFQLKLSLFESPASFRKWSLELHRYTLLLVTGNDELQMKVLSLVSRAVSFKSRQFHNNSESVRLLQMTKATIHLKWLLPIAVFEVWFEKYGAKSFLILNISLLACFKTIFTLYDTSMKQPCREYLAGGKLKLPNQISLPTVPEVTRWNSWFSVTSC